MKKEYTYVMIKPDGVKKNLVSKITTRIMAANFKITNVKHMYLSPEKVREHYAHLVERDFYPELESYITSGMVVGMIVIGEDVVNKIRILVGPTDSRKAPKSTIRGAYGTDSMQNIIHASDSIESAKTEVERFYGKEVLETMDIEPETPFVKKRGSKRK